jgi:hypothetical protein
LFNIASMDNWLITSPFPLFCPIVLEDGKTGNKLSILFTIVPL